MAVPRECFLQILSNWEEEGDQFGALRQVRLLFLFLVDQSLGLLFTLWVMLSQLLRAAAGALCARQQLQKQTDFSGAATEGFLLGASLRRGLCLAAVPVYRW